MPVTIENLTPDFLAFWQQAKGRPLPEQEQLWHELYQARHPDVFEVYQDYGGRLDRDDRLAAALVCFPAHLSTLEPLIYQAPKLVIRTAEATRQVFGAAPAELPFVLMVGLFRSNGWADLLRGRQTAFLALEQFATPQALEITVAHETAHVLHLGEDPARWNEHDVGEKLFKEGLAVCASEQVVPGLTAGEYLWFGPGFEDWVTRCTERWAELREEVLRDLDRQDEATADRHFTYFPDQLGERGERPTRAGYFVGYQVVSYLTRRHSLRELASWSPTEAKEAVRQVLTTLPTLNR